MNFTKVAQIAAYFLLKEGGSSSRLKMMKLMYLADRESMRVRGFSMSEDLAVSMPHGPVLSQTLELMSGDAHAVQWDELVQPMGHYDLTLAPGRTGDDLDELAPSDIAVCDAIYAKFGSYSKYQLRDWTHENCPEWVDPHGSSRPIEPASVFRAVGFSGDIAEEMAARYIERRKLTQALRRFN